MKRPNKATYCSDELITFLNPSCPDHPDEKRKLTLIFIFVLLCGVSKGFMKTFRAFRKLFEAPQRSVKIEIQVTFYFMQLSEMNGAERV